MDIVASFNPSQRQAVETTEGPLLVLAGPGSGKTRVITHRVAYLIRECGINPCCIMVVTFTNKAAREIQERLVLLLGQQEKGVTLGTFHSICARILRREGKTVGLSPDFVIYDDDDQLGLIKQVLRESNLDAKKYTPRSLLSAISSAKNHLLDTEAYAAQAQSYFEEIVQRVYERYQRLLQRGQAVDFDDLLLKTVDLFNKHPAVLEKYQADYHYVMVDEFQDTNAVQYIFIKQLAGGHHNICVVGDPDQSIYSWRFADIGNIRSFEEEFPCTNVVLLEQNYRSTGNILEAASDIIAGNVQRKQNKLWTENEEGAKITVAESLSEEEEAHFVAEEIERLVKEEGMSFKDSAVMYRVNAQSRVPEEIFIRYNIPYRLIGGTRFYHRHEVKDVIAYLRLIHNLQDDLSLLRIINVPVRGVGQRTIQRIQEWAGTKKVSLYDALKQIMNEESSPFNPRITQALTGFVSLIDDLMTESRCLDLPSLIDRVIEKTGYREYLMEREGGESRWENILELREVAAEFSEFEPHEARVSFLEKVSLVSEVDGLDDRVDAATLITLHQAKGLEFRVVFIVGMEEGLLPHRRAFDSPEEMEEERRLCYVGVTRAKERLYLLRTYRRSFFGTRTANPPSRFLRDISSHLVINGGSLEKYLKPERIFNPQLEGEDFLDNELTLKIGDYVRHSMFGDGVVVDCFPVRNDYEIIVDFKGEGVKKLLFSLAPLEKLEGQEVPVSWR